MPECPRRHFQRSLRVPAGSGSWQNAGEAVVGRERGCSPQPSASGTSNPGVDLKKSLACSGSPWKAPRCPEPRGQREYTRVTRVSGRPKASSHGSLSVLKHPLLAMATPARERNGPHTITLVFSQVTSPSSGLDTNNQTFRHCSPTWKRVLRHSLSPSDFSAPRWKCQILPLSPTCVWRSVFWGTIRVRL